MSKLVLKQQTLLSAVTLTKLRERSADSVVYVLPEHTVLLPQTVTITSDLPVIRKNNAGTVKTTVNARISSDIGSAVANVVPVIAKLQTSFPVGCSSSERQAAIQAACIAALAEVDEMDRLFYQGLLPEGSGHSSTSITPQPPRRK